jgi:Uma2 family endonuclease
MVRRTRTDAVLVRIPRRRFTVTEFHRMAEVGVLSDHDRVELLDGQVVQMSPIGVPHASSVDRLAAVLMRRLAGRANVRVQGPIVLDRFSQPQPDVSVLAARPDFYRAGHPRPRDVLLAIEVMDSSEGYDRTLKLPLYAKAELREVWLVDLKAEHLDVYRRPALRGFREHRTFTRGQAIAPLAFPRTRFRVAELLG